MIIDFLKKHRERRVSEIAKRINTDWDGEPSNPSWDRAVKKYAEEVYEDHMKRRGEHLPGVGV